VTDSTSERSSQPTDDLDFWNADADRQPPRELPPLAIPLKPVRRSPWTVLSLVMIAFFALVIWLVFSPSDPPQPTARSLPAPLPARPGPDTVSVEALPPQPTERELHEAKLARTTEEQAKQIQDLEMRLRETERFTQRVRESALKSDEQAIRSQLALAQRHLELGCQEGSERRPFHLLSAVRLSQIDVPRESPELFAEAARIRESCRQVAVDRITHSGRLLTAPLWHDDQVTSVAISPDGIRILTGSRDNTARLWDANTGAPIGKPLLHPAGVTQVAFSPDGRRLLTGCSDFAARIWDPETGEVVGAPMRHALWLTVAAFSPDGERIITASYDGTARLWDSAGQPICEPLRHDGTVTSAAISPDGGRLVTASADRTARLWDGKTGVPLGKALRHAHEVTCVAFSPAGDLVLTGSRDCTVRLWEAEDGEPAGEPLQRDDAVTCLTFNPDGLRFVVGSDDGAARIFELETMKPLGLTLRHSGAVRSVAFSPAGDRVLTGSSDGTARVWDAATGDAVTSPLHHEAEVNSVAFDADGSRILTASADGAARIWAAEELRPADYRPPGRTLIDVALTHELSDLMTIRRIEFRADGKNTVELRTGDSLTFDRTRVLSSGNATTSVSDLRNGHTVRFVHGTPVVCAAISSDGARVLTATEDDRIILWDAETGEVIGDPLPHPGEITLLLFSPDGEAFATHSNGAVRVWSTDTREPLGQPALHEDPVTGMAVSPDGERLLTWSRHTAYLWKLLSGTATGTPMKHDDDITCAAFNPDGTQILTGSRDRTARLWDGVTGNSLGVTVRHEGQIDYVAFAANGSRLVTAGDDRTARLWDVVSGFPLGEPLRHAEGVLCVAISPTGDQIVTGGTFGTQHWNAFEPRHRNLASAKFEVLLALWTGRDARNERHGRIPTATLDGLRERLAEKDEFRLSAERRYLDQQTAFHKIAQASARYRSDPFAATFHAERTVADDDERQAIREKAAAAVNPQFRVNEGILSSLLNGMPLNIGFHLASGRRDALLKIFDKDQPREARISIRISSPLVPDDIHGFQRITVKPHTRYRLSGWIRTEDVQSAADGAFGASLSIHGTTETSLPLIGTHDWTHVELVFDSGHRRTVRIGPRLGHTDSRCTGTAWFADLKFDEISDASPATDVSK
jgi:WD40 repeat protein